MKTVSNDAGRQNVLIIYTDQQRWSALGANGNTQIKTPNLDRLAKRGVNFDRCFVQSPVCMPSRVSMLSGRYPSSLGITHMGVPVPETLLTLPRMLKPYGYRTANFGKLHFLPHANRDHREAHPDYGFDCLEVSDEPGVYEDAYRAWVKEVAPEQLDHLSVGLPPATRCWQQNMELEDTVRHPFGESRDDFKGAVRFSGSDGLTHSAFVASRTIDFLCQQRSDGEPFLCVAGFFSPHAPWVVPQAFLDLYEPEELDLPDCPDDADLLTPGRLKRLRSARHGYFAAISEVDHYVGRILDTLEERKLADRTIIVFTSDHGEWLGEHGRWGKSCPGSDVVSRVPMMVVNPRASIEGEQCHEIIESVDLVPSLLEMVGIQPMPQLQGLSFASAFRAGGFQGKSFAMMEFNGWKNIRTDRYRYLLHQDGREEFWDIEEDPGESRSISDDPAYREALVEHRHMMLQRLLEIERPLPRIWPY